jgi:membrane associated rhomboid family serine protease
MRRTVAETIVSFLLGAAWAIVLLGFVLFFWSFMPYGLVVAVMAALVGSLFGLFLVVMLEVAALQFEKHRELKRQTHLLKKIREALERGGDDQVCDH